MNKSILLLTACSGLTAATAVAQDKRPNIVIIYTDDMGIGDVSCFNSGWVMTPNIDRMAAKGLKFNHYYTSSPVSSPSRVGITTGMFPTEWGINTFLHERKGNANCEQCDYLDSNAPTIAKSLKAAGYGTAHIGKWHMGGGRDVDDAPQIPKYGFDEYLSTYESPDPDKLITATNWIWSEKDSIKRWERTGYFVDKALDYMARQKDTGKPCFVNLWPDDMHTPWVPSAEFYGKNKTFNEKENFVAVLQEYDRQIGRFMDGLEKLGIADNTIVIFTSDNGAYPTFDQVRSNGHRGTKNSLYEGGVNMPFIIVWPDKIKPGQVDDESVISAVDIYPSLCKIAGAKQIPGFNYSGEDMSKALTGVKPQKRKKDLMWDFGRNRFFGKPAQPHQQSPHLSLRRGDWKVLVCADGTRLELYNIKEDPNETTNIADKHQKMASEMSEKVINWYYTKRKVRQQ